MFSFELIDRVTGCEFSKRRVISVKVETVILQNHRCDGTGMLKQVHEKVDQKRPG